MSYAFRQNSRVMKNIRTILMNAGRKTRPVAQQLELPLPGSRLTRNEASFLVQIRQLREELLAKAA